MARPEDRSRRTRITRLVSRGLPIAEIMPPNGDSTLAAFSIYVNSADAIVRRGAEAIDAYHEEFAIQPASEPVN